MKQKNAVISRTAVLENNKKTEVKLPIIIHPKNSGIIIINYPGFNGEINGYNNKYRTLAKLMQERIGAVIQSGNQYHEMLDYEESVKDDLRAVIEYSLENAENICQTKIPTIYLVGFSAGASAIAAVAHEYPAVSKILLISPSADAGFESLQKGLSEYTGEVYILSGSNDDVVGPEIAITIAQMVKKTVSHHVVLPNCDHQLRGQENGLILSNAPRWAFLGNIAFPSKEGGTVLY